MSAVVGAPVEEAHVLGSKIEFKSKRPKPAKIGKSSSKAKAAGKASMLTFDEDNDDES
jgi:hypothetical protein